MYTLNGLAATSLLVCVGTLTTITNANTSEAFQRAALTCAITSTWSVSMPAALEADPSQLDTLMAPIALYPDPLVIQILECAQKPDQVKKLNDWIKQNPDLKGTAAQDAATTQGFEPSYVAMVLFPSVVGMMADKPDWTTSVGQAFAKDRSSVFDSIQRLRAQAQAMGNLKTSPQQTVETTKTSSGQDVIVIQPANPQVVYVPQYSPTVVYTQAPPPQQSSSDAAVAGLVGFTAGVIIGAAIADNNNNVYYHCGGWGYSRVTISNEGWNNYANYRQDMANDYYAHRDNMVNQRGENQAGRQDASSANQANRQATSSANQAARETTQTSRQETSTTNQANRQDAAATSQATRETSQSANQASRQDAAASSQASREASQSANQASRQQSAQSVQSTASQNAGSYSASAKARGSSASASAGSASGTASSAFSSYQSGASERTASARGRASTSSSAATRSGGASRSRR